MTRNGSVRFLCITPFISKRWMSRRIKGVARERIHPSTKKKMTAADKMRISVITNVILVLLVAVLFIITLNGENANALNYRKAIQNEYASWEQELTEREKAVKEKEQELQIENDKDALEASEAVEDTPDGT